MTIYVKRVIRVHYTDQYTKLHEVVHTDNGLAQLQTSGLIRDGQFGLILKKEWRSSF